MPLVNKHIENQRQTTQYLLIGCFFVVMQTGCSSIPVNQDGAPDQTMDWESIPDASPQIEPLSKTGNPASYIVDGQRYYVTLDTEKFSQTGRASWYGTKFHGNLTSSGEPYDMYKMTAAHKSLPLPSYVSVRNLENNRSVIVKVNDRGPFVDGRVIDLSYAAAQRLDIVKNGTAEVAIEVLAAPQTSQTISDSTASDALVLSALGPGRKYFVQIGAFSEMGNAEKFRSQLAAQSIEPTLIRSYSDINGDLHKVQIGPFSNTRDIELLESRLSELGYTQLFIVTE